MIRLTFKKSGSNEYLNINMNSEFHVEYEAESDVEATELTVKNVKKNKKPTSVLNKKGDKAKELNVNSKRQKRN